MDELVEWLRAQLDEDERLARRLLDDTRPDRAERWEFCDDGAIRDTGAHRSLRVKFTWPPEAAHIVRHDPARVLREIDAKRRTIALCEPPLVEVTGPGDAERSFVPGQGEPWGLDVLKLLALPYADRPGYNESWRP